MQAYSNVHHVCPMLLHEYFICPMLLQFGGMNEVLYRLFRLTKKDSHLELAHLFDKPRW